MKTLKKLLRTRHCEERSESLPRPIGYAAIHVQVDNINYRNYTMNAKEIRLYFLVAIPATFGMGMLFYHSVILSILISAATIPLRKFRATALANKRKALLGLQFRDLLGSLSSSFITGRKMTESLTIAMDDLLLIFEADTPIMVELADITNRLINGKESEREVMYDFAERSGLGDIADFIDVYYTCLSTGGDIVSAVTKSSSQIMDKLTIERDIKAITASKKYETIILLILPPVILLFLHFSSPDYMTPLYGNPVGILFMTIALGIMAVSYIWSLKITDIGV
jgi:tight adherence protein B